MKRYSLFFFVAALVVSICLLGTSSAFAGKTTFVSTDFNKYSFDRSLWTLVNPRGDGSISMVNTGTADASIAIKAGDGFDHNLYTDGDYTVAIMQNATDTDFRLEAKFFSPVTAGTWENYNGQGVLIQENATSKIEFCFTSYPGDSARAFAATFLGSLSNYSVKVNKRVAAIGEGPLWMRISRTGDTWRFITSLDGAAWDTVVTFTAALTVTKVGPFVLNGGDGAKRQAFSGVVDYFHNLDSIKNADDAGVVPADTVAPWIHSARVTDYAANAMRVVWCTDKPSDGVVRYGTTTAYGTNEYSLDVKTEHSAFLASLTPASTYHYKVEAGDAGGHSSSTGDFTQALPAIVTDASSVSDAFVDTSLNTSLWTLVDKKGDVLTAIISGQLAITVPAGSAHDLWTDSDTEPRVVQNLGSSNSREFIARFNSGVTGTSTTYRTQGMVFDDNNGHPLRFEFLSMESSGEVKTKAFAASFPYGMSLPVSRFNVDVGPQGIAPIYMRVRQYGAQWTMDYSTDGTIWTTAGSFWDFSSPTSVGLAAGNTADDTLNSPEHTALIDFFQGALPAKPRLGTPVNDATLVALPVQLTWSATIGATGYHAQVARDSLFTVLVANDSTLTNPVKNLTGLQTDTKYYWRVKAKNTKGNGAYSAIWHFTTIPGIPGAPALLAPANGAVNQPVNPTLRWSKIASALTYHVQLGADSTFAASVVVEDSTITDTTYATIGLTEGIRYYWRVRTKNVSGIGPWSTVRNFRTIVPLPSAVNLLLPAMNALATKDTVLLVWGKGTPEVTRYTVVHGPDSMFAFGTTDSTITDTVKVLRSLMNGTRYFWKVRAGNVAGWGPYSTVRAFNVVISSVGSDRELPKEFVLSQNYPNPFNPATRIEFGVPQTGHVLLEVYNMLGEKVATLVDGERQAGYHEVSFDGARFASGVYFYRLETNTTALMKKMILVK